MLTFILLWSAQLSYASLIVTDPEGNPPGEYFTDFTMVPGDSQSTTLIVTQQTDATVTAGIRFEALSEIAVLHDAIEMTVEGLGSTQTMSLTAALEREDAFWLGELPPSEQAEITLTAHFPFSAGNETQGTEARFQVMITAHQFPPEGTSQGETRPTEASPDVSTAPGVKGPKGQLPDTGTRAFQFILLACAMLLTGWAVLRMGKNKSHRAKPEL